MLGSVEYAAALLTFSELVYCDVYLDRSPIQRRC